MVSPVRSDWKYSVREKVKFNVKVFKGNVLWEGVKISYEIGSEKMPSTLVKEEILKDGMLTIDGGMMKIAGFLRCTVKTEYQGKSFREWTTAGFSPKKLNQQLCSLLILRIFGIKPSKRIPNSR